MGQKPTGPIQDRIRITPHLSPGIDRKADGVSSHRTHGENFEGRVHSVNSAINLTTGTFGKGETAMQDKGNGGGHGSRDAVWWPETTDLGPGRQGCDAGKTAFMRPSKKEGEGDCDPS